MTQDHECQIMAFWNEKGGDGKTSLGTHMAAGLAVMRPSYRVLLIDADQQGNSTEVMNLPKSGCFYDFSVRQAQLKSVVKPVPAESYEVQGFNNGKLYMIPGNPETVGVVGQIRDPKNFLDRFKTLRKVFTHIVFDLNPAPTLLHDLVLQASDWLVIPTSLEVLSVETGIKQALARTSAIREKGTLKVLGIVPNKYREKTTMHKGYLDELKSRFPGVVANPIRLSTALPESQYVRRSLFSYAPTHPATHDLWEMVVELNRRMVQNDVGVING